MPHEVYANGNEIAAKSGMNKVIASFPDVCLTPPSPPAGPIPVPYPNTSFSSDLKEGSQSVKLGGDPAALAQQSYYKASALGDEAATRGLGMNVINHSITGKTYFKAWSFDVQIEGKNVCRHLDITTSNHMSEPPGDPTPNPGTENAKPAAAPATPTCDCCSGPAHSKAQAEGKKMTGKDWYAPNYPSHPPQKREQAAMDAAAGLFDLAKASGCPESLPKDDPSDPCSAHYVTTIEEKRKIEGEYATMMEKIDPANTLEQLSKAYGPKLGQAVFERGQRLNAALADKSQVSSIAHRTAKAAGGCPIGEGNLEPVPGTVANPKCAEIEGKMAQAQQGLASYHRRANGLRYK